MKSRWLRIDYGLYIVVFASVAALQLLTAGYLNPDLESQGNVYFMAIFAGLMFSPVFINVAVGESEEDIKWRIRLQNILRYSVYASLGVTGMMWYLEPERSHLEPATVLLGFAAAYITYQIDRNKNIEQSNLV